MILLAIDFDELLQDAIAYLVANIPSLLSILAIILYNLRYIKKDTSVFPTSISELKAELSEKWENTKETAKEQYETLRDNVTSDLKETVAAVKSSVNDSLTAMKSELKDYADLLGKYSDKLTQNNTLINSLTLENKAYIDVILALVAQDPQKVSSGVATIVASKLTLTKEELEKYPENIVAELPALKIALASAYVALGEEKFKEMLEDIGYGENGDTGSESNAEDSEEGSAGEQETL